MSLGPWETSRKLLALDWLVSGHSGHLEGEPADGKLLSLSVSPLCLCKSVFQLKTNNFLE